MEQARKNLKISSMLVLLFVGLSLVQIVTELIFVELNAVPIPEGSPDNILLITKTFVIVIALILMLPKIYVGVKGLNVAKNPTASKGHIIVAVIIFVLSILSLIEPAMGILKQDGSGSISSLFNILLEAIIYYEYIHYARIVAKLSE